MEIIKKENGKITLRDSKGNIYNVTTNEKRLSDYTPAELKIMDNQISYNTQLMCIDYPYHGFITMCLVKNFTDRRDTMCVYVNGLNHFMDINPCFWENLQEKHKIGLLLHEISHIAFFHTLIDDNLYSNKMILGMALDIVVNQYIKTDLLPSDRICIEKFPELRLKKDEGVDYYYNMLMDKSNQNKSQTLKTLLDIQKEMEDSGESMDGMTISGNDLNVQMTSHKNYGENMESMKPMSDTEKNIIEGNLVYILTEAEEAAKKAGSMPGKFSEVLEKVRNPPKPRYNYHKFLRRFAGESGESYVVNTRMRPNFLIPENPGTRTEGMPNVLLAWDVSGSMSKKLLTNLQVDLMWIQRQGYPITLLQFDTRITSVEPYKKNMQIQLKGRGGTDFQSVYDYFVEHQNTYTCMIVFSDGYARAPKPTKVVNQNKILWCFTDKNEDSFPGKKIYIDEELKQIDL